LDYHKRAAQKNPAAPEFQRDLASCYNGLGALYVNLSFNDPLVKKIEELFTKGLSIREQLAREHPRISEYQSDLARAVNNLGLFYTFRDRPKQATEAYAKALRVRLELAHKYPDVASHQVAVAKTYHDLGLLHKINKNPVEAESAFREALNRQERICRAHPQNSQYAIDRPISLLSLGALVADRGKPRKALDG